MTTSKGGQPTEWYLVLVDDKGIKMLRGVDKWLEQPMEVRNSYLLNEINNGVVVFKILLPLNTVNTCSRLIISGDKKDNADALNWLHSTMAGWYCMRQYNTMVWLATTAAKRYAQIRLFSEYMNKVCVSGHLPKKYFSNRKHRFFGRTKELENEALEAWGAKK
mgnify:CR=1 FL=1